jgi:hypothetical protein
MGAVAEASSVHGGEVAASSRVRERLEAFAGEVLAGAMNRPVQRVNGGLYLRGLLEQGPRKSLEPMVARLGGGADYQSLQQFVADSPWDPALVVGAVAERVAPQIEVEAWVLDDTGFPKDGRDSPGVKRQYSGTLGKTGNCQKLLCQECPPCRHDRARCASAVKGRRCAAGFAWPWRAAPVTASRAGAVRRPGGHGRRSARGRVPCGGG